MWDIVQFKNSLDVENMFVKHYAHNHIYACP